MNEIKHEAPSSVAGTNQLVIYTALFINQSMYRPDNTVIDHLAIFAANLLRRSVYHAPWRSSAVEPPRLADSQPPQSYTPWRCLRLPRFDHLGYNGLNPSKNTDYELGQLCRPLFDNAIISRPINGARRRDLGIKPPLRIKKIQNKN